MGASDFEENQISPTPPLERLGLFSLFFFDSISWFREALEHGRLGVSIFFCISSQLQKSGRERIRTQKYIPRLYDKTGSMISGFPPRGRWISDTVDDPPPPGILMFPAGGNNFSKVKSPRGKPRLLRYHRAKSPSFS